MARVGRLRGAAHDIGHHAGSGLSFLYPHLADVSRAAGTLTVTLDLLSPSDYPSELPLIEPLQHALVTLRARCKEIIVASGFSWRDLTVATLTFGFPIGYGDGSLFSVRTVLGTSTLHVMDERPLHDPS